MLRFFVALLGVFAVCSDASAQCGRPRQPARNLARVVLAAPVVVVRAGVAVPVETARFFAHAASRLRPGTAATVTRTRVTAVSCAWNCPGTNGCACTVPMAPGVHYYVCPAQKGEPCPNGCKLPQPPHAHKK